jgi:hypothetical protein
MGKMRPLKNFTLFLEQYPLYVFPMNPKVKHIIDFALNYQLEITSYGISPNINGFRFEDRGNNRPQVHSYFSELLKQLNDVEKEQLRKTVL